HPLEHPEIEFPAEDGGARERLVASRREPREAASDDLANSFRDAHLLDRFSPARPPAIAAIERTGPGEGANHLLDEGRVAFRVALQGFREGHAHGIELVLREGLEQCMHLVRREATEKNAFEDSFAPQIGENRRERMAPIELDIAVRSDDQDAA